MVPANGTSFQPWEYTQERTRQGSNLRPED
jgi:hypothetical protein